MYFSLPKDQTIFNMVNHTLKLSHFVFSRNKTSEIKDEDLVDGILNNSNKAIEQIYKRYYPKIKRMVWSFKNTILQPEDIFQEGLTRTILNIREGKFRGDSSLYTYLNSTCYNLCLKELSKHRSAEITKDVELEEENDSFELYAPLLGILNQLDKQCHSIIDIRFNLSAQNNMDNPEEARKSIPFEAVAGQIGSFCCQCQATI